MRRRASLLQRLSVIGAGFALIGLWLAPAASAIVPAFDPTKCTGAAFMVDRFYPDAAVNGAQPNDFDTGGKQICLQHLATYHWNNGQGAPDGGEIFLADSSGQMVQSWEATATPGTNDLLVNWETVPNPINPLILLNGTYTVTDSDPATWSSSEQSGGLGFIRVWGVEYAGGGSVPGASQTPVPGGTGNGSGTGGSSVLWLGLAVIVVLAGLGLWFWSRRGRPSAAGAKLGGLSTVSAEDPCPPLVAAARAARAACDEATRAAADARAAADKARADADAAKRELDKARAARQAAEKELEKRQKPPDSGARLGSTGYGGRDVHVDEYDLHLQEQARADANAAHDAALSGATSDEARMQAHDDWVEALRKIDGPDGLDEVRARDKIGREAWVKAAEAALKAAQDAETAAEAEVARTEAVAGPLEAAARAAEAKADAACDAATKAEAAAAACLGAQVKAAEKPPSPPPPPPPPPPPGGGVSPPGGTTPPTGGTPGGTPPTQQKPGCPDGSVPRITTGPPVEVELYVLSAAKLKIAGAFLFGDDDAQAALDGLDTANTVSSVGVGLIGAVTDPVGSILGTLGVPGFDTATSAPAGAAMDALNKLNDALKRRRQIGEWILSAPLQRYRFSCRTTEECVDGAWKVTGRELVSERVGRPRWVDSPPFMMIDPSREMQRAWSTMSNFFLVRNQAAQREIEKAAKACGG